MHFLISTLLPLFPAEEQGRGGVNFSFLNFKSELWNDSFREMYGAYISLLQITILKTRTRS